MTDAYGHYDAADFGLHASADQPTQAKRECDALCRDIEQDRDRLAAEVDQLRRERHLLGPARLMLDRTERDQLRAVVNAVRAAAERLLRQEQQHSGSGRDGHLNEDDLVPLFEALGVVYLDGDTDGLISAPVPGSSVRAQDAHAEGYAEAVARLRDDARYMDWWMSSDAKPDGRIRWHLADYLETVGPGERAPRPGDHLSDLREFLLAREVETAAERNVAPDGPWLREGTPYQLRQYAQRYADHPDYREEWRP